MSEQVLNQFRCDKSLREDCVRIYEALGMDINTAFRMFMERTRMVNGLPFPAVLPSGRMTPSEAKNAVEALRKQAEEMPEMSLDEINAEISAARAKRKPRHLCQTLHKASLPRLPLGSCGTDLGVYFV